MQCFAVEQAAYLLGTRLAGLKRHRPFLIAYDAGDTYTTLWHRGASCPAAPKVCNPDTPYSSTPDANTITGALLWNPLFDDTPKDVRGLNTTIVSLENNMAVPLLFAAVETQGVSASACLNGLKTAFWNRPWCRQGRPQKSRLGPTQATTQLSPDFTGIYVRSFALLLR